VCLIPESIRFLLLQVARLESAIHWTSIISNIGSTSDNSANRVLCRGQTQEMILKRIPRHRMHRFPKVIIMSIVDRLQRASHLRRAECVPERSLQLRRLPGGLQDRRRCRSFPCNRDVTLSDEARDKVIGEKVRARRERERERERERSLRAASGGRSGSAAEK